MDTMFDESSSGEITGPEVMNNDACYTSHQSDDSDEYAYGLGSLPDNLSLDNLLSQTEQSSEHERDRGDTIPSSEASTDVFNSEAPMCEWRKGFMELLGQR